jgi:hypothetical protein
VAITAAGRRAVGAGRGDVRLGATHDLGLRHARAVSWVAALLTLRQREWISGAADASRVASPGAVGGITSLAPPGHRHRVRRRAGRCPGRARAQVAAATSGDLCGLRPCHRHGDNRLRPDLRPDVLNAAERAAKRVSLPRDRFRTRTLEDIQRSVGQLAGRSFAASLSPAVTVIRADQSDAA